MACSVVTINLKINWFGIIYDVILNRKQGKITKKSHLYSIYNTEFSCSTDNISANFVGGRYNTYVQKSTAQKFWATGSPNFGEKWGQNLGKFPNSVSPERLIVWSWLAPHFNWNSHFSIRVSYNIYPSDQRKYPFWAKRAKNGQKSPIIYLPN